MRSVRHHQFFWAFGLGFGGVLMPVAALLGWRLTQAYPQPSLVAHESFLPHGVCFLWSPGLLWLHLISDLLITLAYFSIPVMLYIFVRKRKDLSFSRVFFCFEMFIVSCGVTHALGIWTLWYPDHWLDGGAKAMTALFSVATAVLLVPLLPKALALPSPNDLQYTNNELHRQQAILRAILDGMEGGVIVCDADSKILLSNQSARRILNSQSLADTLDQQLCDYQFYSDRQAPAIPLPDLTVQRLFRGELKRQTEVFVVPPTETDGRWWSISTRPLLPDIPGFVGVVILLRDVTRYRQAEDALRASEERFRSAFGDAPIGMALVAIEGDWLQVNQAVCQITGYNEEELLATSYQMLTHPDDLHLDLMYAELLHSGALRTCQFEKRYIHKQGHEVWVLLHCSLIRDAQGLPWYYLSQIQDITQRKITETALEESQRFVKSMVETTPDIVYVFDTVARRTVYANHKPMDLLGYTPEQAEAIESSGQSLSMLVHADDIPRLFASMERVKHAQDGEVIGTEYRMRRADGCWRWFYSRDVVFLRDQSGTVLQMMGITQDVTDRKQAEEHTLTALKEKEILLAEIHHRVKNNLQVISSLLKLQASSIDNPALFEHLRDSQHRIRSMALVHEKLYQAHDFAHIDFVDYVKSLTHFLLRSYSSGSSVPHIRIQGEALSLDIAWAVPLGLIINELVTNALKYAFPHKQRGDICIHMQMDNSTLTLTVSDTGVGLPETVDLRHPKTLGLRLVHSLVQQLQGTIVFRSDCGTSITITTHGATL
jgi:PAS domain S-box-containing protein